MQANVVRDVWRTIIVIPVTSELKWLRLATCVRVPKGTGGLPMESVALCHQIMVVDKGRIQGQIGVMPPDNLREIEDVLLMTLGLAEE